MKVIAPSFLSVTFVLSAAGCQKYDIVVPKLGQYQILFPARAECTPGSPRSATPFPGTIYTLNADGSLTHRATPDAPDVSDPTNVVFQYVGGVHHGLLTGDLQVAGFSGLQAQPADLTAALESAGVSSIQADIPNARAWLLLHTPHGDSAYMEALEDARAGKNNAVLIKEVITADSLDYTINFFDASAFNAEANVLAKYLGANMATARSGTSVATWTLRKDAAAPTTRYAVLVHAVSGRVAVGAALSPEETATRLAAIQSLQRQPVPAYDVEAFTAAHRAWQERVANRDIIKWKDWLGSPKASPSSVTQKSIGPLPQGEHIRAIRGRPGDLVDNFFFHLTSGKKTEGLNNHDGGRQQDTNLEDEEFLVGYRIRGGKKTDSIRFLIYNRKTNAHREFLIGGTGGEWWLPKDGSWVRVGDDTNLYEIVALNSRSGQTVDDLRVGFRRVYTKEELREPRLENYPLPVAASPVALH